MRNMRNADLETGSRSAPWIAEARCELCLRKTVVRRRPPTISPENRR